MPSKWRMYKESQAGKKIDNAAACLCFLNYLAFLRPAADRALSILPWCFYVVVYNYEASSLPPWANQVIRLFYPIMVLPVREPQKIKIGMDLKTSSKRH
jgi:hypothetical protein